MPRIHRDRMGCYHPAPDSEVAWTVNDTRGYMDTGPSCTECSACECGCPMECGCLCGTEAQPAREPGSPACNPDAHHADCALADQDGLPGWNSANPMDDGCIGLSFAYVCLDGGESYCQECFDKLDDVEVVPCDC